MDQTASATANNCHPCNYYYYSSDGIQYEANFKSPTKRSFLNECIRQIYILNGKAHSVPVTPSPIEFDQDQILHMLNVLVAPPAMARDHRASLDRVKRQLFRETKRKSRKSSKPQKNTSQQMELYYFKAVRMQLGVKRLRRHYMEEQRQHSKRKFTGSDGDDSAGALTKSFRIDKSAGHMEDEAKVRKYQKNQREESRPQRLTQKRESNAADASRQNRRLKKLHHHLMEQQYRNQLYMNELMLEESLRSLFYMKALLNLAVDQEENLYI